MDSALIRSAPILDEALALSQQGLPCFPCSSRKNPTTPQGYKDATRDPDALRELWHRYPGPLIGVVTGEMSGLNVLILMPDMEAPRGLPDIGATCRQRVFTVAAAGDCTFFFNIRRGWAAVPGGLQLGSMCGAAAAMPSGGLQRDFRCFRTCSRPRGLNGCCPSYRLQCDPPPPSSGCLTITR
jgi:hypothetical protein